MKDYGLCEKCASGQKNVVGRKCQGCIDNKYFEDAEKADGIIKRKGGVDHDR